MLDTSRARVLMDTVEHVYSDEPSERLWLQSILDAMLPAVDRGLGAFIFAVEPSVWPPRIGESVGAGAIPQDWRERVVALQRILRGKREATEVYFPSPSADTASTLLGRKRWQHHDLVRHHLSSIGIADFIVCFARRSRREFITVGVPVPSLARLSSVEALRLGRVAVHLSAAFRLRRTVPGAVRLDDTADAILSPSGKVEHAKGRAARASGIEALRARAVELERARGTLRRTDPERGLELWRALVEGRWSLVERFDRDGRRFYVARENTPDAPGPPGLTEAERQVVSLLASGHANKLVAYALGISQQAVSMHLRGAMAKLNVASRAELVQLAMSTGAASELAEASA